MEILKKSLLASAVTVAFAGCSANGGFPDGDTPPPPEALCAQYTGGTVTAVAEGGGCNFEPAVTCSVTEEANAADADPSTFATVTVTATGLDLITGFGGQATDVGVDVALSSLITPGPDVYAGFEIEIPGMSAELSILESIIIETSLAGVPTGESVDAGPPADVGGAIFGGRVLVGFVPTLPFDGLSIRFGGLVTVDADEHAFIYDACTATPPAE